MKTVSSHLIISATNAYQLESKQSGFYLMPYSHAVQFGVPFAITFQHGGEDYAVIIEPETLV